MPISSRFSDSCTLHQAWSRDRKDRQVLVIDWRHLKEVVKRPGNYLMVSEIQYSEAGMAYNQNALLRGQWERNRMQRNYFGSSKDQLFVFATKELNCLHVLFSDPFITCVEKSRVKALKTGKGEGGNQDRLCRLAFSWQRQLQSTGYIWDYF